MKANRNFIITLTGASMCGKSYVMDKFSEMEEELRKEGIVFSPVRIKKYTTRDYRIEELEQIISGGEQNVDVESVEKLPEDCDLVYQTYGKQYGLKKSTLKYWLNEGKCPIVVINDVRVVEELKKAFPQRVLSLYIFRKIPRMDSFINVAGKRGGVENLEVSNRYNKAIAIHRTYIENISLFDRVILNVKDYYGKPGEIDCTRLQIKNIIKGVMSSKIKLSGKNRKNKKLFIICGNAASGKDDIIQSINTMGKLQAFILPKYTSRAQDIDDGGEMICQYIPRGDIIKRFEQDTKRERSMVERMMLAEEGLKVSEVRSKQIKLLRNVKSPEERFWTEIDEFKFQRYVEFCVANKIESLVSRDVEECPRLRARLDDVAREALMRAMSSDASTSQLIPLVVEDRERKNNEELLSSNCEIEPESIATRLKRIKTRISEKIGSKNTLADFENNLAQEILDSYFEKNPAYECVDLQKLKDKNKEYIEPVVKQQILGMTGPCYCIENNKDGYVMYENNETLYGFSIERYENGQAHNFIEEKMETEKKHCVLVASLIDIYKVCREKFSKDRVVAVFSYSQISAEEYLAKSRDGTTDRKARSFEKEIEKYSEYIEHFDYVTIYAESVMGNNVGSSKEELIDQMFRLFRAYN